MSSVEWDLNPGEPPKLRETATAYRYRSLRDAGPRRKHDRFAVLAPDGSIVRIYSGSFAAADAGNEAARLNRKRAES